VQKQTKDHIKLALASDPDIDGQLQKKVFSLLEGKSTRRNLISTGQACAILGCHAITLRRAEKRGHLKAIRYSARRLRWDESEIIEFANRGIPSGENA